MQSWIAGKLLQVLLLFFLVGSLTPVAAQDSSDVPSSKSPAAAIEAKAPPFDRLELFAFLASGPYPPYAAAAIRERGVDFTPKEPFLLSYPSRPIREALALTSPVGPHPLSQNRQQSLVLLSKIATLVRDQRCANAAQDLQEALRLAPDSPGLHFVAATCAMSPRDWPQMERESRVSLRLWSGNADAHILLAYALNNQGRSKDAIPEAREALHIFPDHKGATMQLGIALSNSGQYAEAVPILEQSAALNQQATIVEKYLGLSLLETNQPAKAVDPLVSFLKRFPNDAEGHYLLGTTFRALGRKDDAQAHFEEAHRLNPQSTRFQAAANPDASLSSSGTTSGPKPDPGAVSGNLYSNNFFQFTYEFPDGWTVLSADASRSLVEIGGALLSTGDPTEAETRRVAAQLGYPLLTLMQRRARNQVIAVSTIVIVAIDAHDAPNVDPVSAELAIADRLKQSVPGFALLDTPKMVTIAGRNFANSHHAIHMANGQVYTSQFVTKEKGFLLMINLNAPDQGSLPELENSLNTLHFLQNPD